MDKAPDAFRTISEVAEALETPAHVLRFWESRFPQIKPVKRAGGRRYYRPSDVALLSGIRQLLHAEGMTIRGVQKILREQGVRHVAALGGSDIDEGEMDADVDYAEEVAVPVAGQVLPISALPRRPTPSLPTGASAEVQPLFSAGMSGKDETSKSAGAASGAEIAPVPPEKPFPAPADVAVPREGEGGFIAFSSPRSPRPKTRTDDPLQPTLPFDVAPPAASQDEVPEAPHLWVESEDDLQADVTPIPSAPWADASSTVDMAARDGGTQDAAPAIDSESETAGPESATAASQGEAEPAPESPVLALAGLAARLRRIGPVSQTTRAELAELHSRLGLLHAQMAEAVRLRR